MLGESLLPAFAGASFLALVTVSPPRGARLLPFTNQKVSAPATKTHFGATRHGLFTRCLRFAAFLPSFPVVRPHKTRFQVVVNLAWVGLVTH